MLTYDLAGPEGDYPAWDGLPRRSIILCTHPRSGSSLLGEALTFAGGFGCPLEYFHGGFRPAFEQRWDAHTEADYIAALRRHRTDPNGTLAVKLFWGDVALIVSRVSPNLGAGLARQDAQALPDESYRAAHDILCEIMPDPTWLTLERRDMIRQSISHVRALRNNRWRGISKPGLRLNPPAPYVFEDLLQGVQWAHNCRLQWHRFFAANGLSPYQVTYESLLADRDAVLLALFRALGGVHTQVPELRMIKQADALSDEWHTRFLSDLRRQGPGDGFQLVESRDAMD